MNKKRTELSSVPFEVIPPLSIQKGKDGVSHLTYPKRNEDFGKIVDNKLMMFNSPANTDDTFIFYNPQEIECA